MKSRKIGPPGLMLTCTQTEGTVVYVCSQPQKPKPNQLISNGFLHSGGQGCEPFSIARPWGWGEGVLVIKVKMG